MAIGAVKGLLNCAVVEWKGVCAEVCGLTELLVCHYVPMYVCTMHKLQTCICICGYLWMLCMMTANYDRSCVCVSGGCV